MQGRKIEAADIERIRQLLQQNPAWSRRRLSQVLASEWDWRNGHGQLKDMAARSLLVKLGERWDASIYGTAAGAHESNGPPADRHVPHGIALRLPEHCAMPDGSRLVK